MTLPHLCMDRSHCSQLLAGSLISSTHHHDILLLDRYNILLLFFFLAKLESDCCSQKIYKVFWTAALPLCSQFANISGCAVGSDGTLINASQIEFFNDPDTTILISGSSYPLTSMSSTSLTSVVSRVLSTLNIFISCSCAPAVITAESHCSAQVPQPSTKVTDPNNGALPETVSAGYKHKAARAANTVPASCHRIQDTQSDSNFNNDLSESKHKDVTTNNELKADGRVDGKEDLDAIEYSNGDTEVAYEETKGMSDSDCVSVIHMLSFFIIFIWLTGKESLHSRWTHGWCLHNIYKR